MRMERASGSENAHKNKWVRALALVSLHTPHARQVNTHQLRVRGDMDVRWKRLETPEHSLCTSFVEDGAYVCNSS